MLWFKEHRVNIIVNFINIIFLVSVMKVCYGIKNFDYIFIVLMFLAAVVVWYFYSEILKYLIYKILFSSILIFIFLFLIYKNSEAFLYYISTKFVDNFNYINDLLYDGSATEFALFKHYFIIILPLVSIVMMLLYSKGLTESILVLNLMIMLLFWYLEYVQEVKSLLFPFIALSVSTYTLNNHIKYLKKLSKLGIKSHIRSKNIFVNMAIYSIIVAVVGMLLPQNYSGNYSEETIAKWTNPFSPDSRESIAKAKAGRFGLNSSGYSNTESELGGPLTLNSQLALQVKADRQLYLRGEVKDVYTGKSWIKDEENYQDKSDISDSATNKLLENRINLGLEGSKIYVTIIPKGLTTNTVFVPYYTSKIHMDKGKVYFEANGETFINSSKVTKEYSIEVYDPEKVQDFINSSYAYRDISVRRQRSDKYLDYPKEISVRTIELVYEIVKNSKTNKDKVEAIKSYLSQAYPYTLEVSEVPEDAEFLDYFLFTEKKGYCTYFATAMTIMCRIAGIPARYVEGYKMPAQSSNGIYDVTNEQAHAWTEVLYQEEPQLWVVKDPSPTPLEARERLEQQQAAEVSAMPASTPSVPVEEQSEEVQKNVDEDRDFNNNDSVKAIDYKVVYSISLIVIILLYFIARLLYFNYRLNGVLKHKSNIPLYNYSLKRLKVVGIKKEASETDKNFIKKLDNIEFSDYMSELVDVVYGEFYGGVREVDFDRIKLHKALEEYIKTKQNTVIYKIKKYFI